MSSKIKKKILFSLISAVTLIIAGYFINNSPLFTGENMLQFHVTQKLCKFFSIHKTVNYGDARYYNVSYDKELVPAIVQGDTIGVNVITDRKKLHTFLQLLQKSNRYKFIILDLTFDKKDVNTEIDDSLFNTIRHMRDLVVVSNDNIDFAIPDLADKTALAEFYVTLVSTNFSRYKFMDRDRRSVPLFIFEKLHPEKSFSRIGWGALSLYFSNGKLCQNTHFLTFDDSTFETEDFELWQNQNLSLSKYENIGEILAEAQLPQSDIVTSLEISTKDRIVVIGNLVSDVHDTYMGCKAGGVILMRAFQTLEDGKNIVSFSHTGCWLILFFFISLHILSDKQLSFKIPIIRKIPYRSIHFLLSLTSYGVVLFICSSFDYILCDHVYSLTLPILYFALLKLSVQYRKYDTLKT